MLRIAVLLRLLPLLVEHTAAPLGVDSNTISPSGATAARNDASVSSPSRGQRETSEQWR